MEYTVELDGINGCGTNFYEPHNHAELINWVQEDLKTLGGGHADIYDEDGEFVEDIEV